MNNNPPDVAAIQDMMHHAMMMNKFKEALVIALVQRLAVNGVFTIPVQEIDEVAGVRLVMSANDADHSITLTLEGRDNVSMH